MLLKDFLEIFDDHNKYVVVNDNKLNAYARVIIYRLLERYNDYHTILDAQVLAFGYYDDELVVRVNI